MANCKWIDDCDFFQNRVSGSLLLDEVYKQRYCQGDPSTCARYQVGEKLGPKDVPADLFPADVHLVQKVLHAAA